MVTIRGAEPDDDRALLALDAATWSTAVTPGPRPDPDGSYFDEQRRPEGHLVAEVDGEVVGYTVLHQTIPVPSHDHVLEVNGMAVDPAHQGQGLGRQLIAAAQQEAVRRGARKLTLRVLGGNRPARSLYESCGFVVEGVLRGEFHLDGRDVDDVLMAWWP